MVAFQLKHSKKKGKLHIQDFKDALKRGEEHLEHLRLNFGMMRGFDAEARFEMAVCLDEMGRSFSELLQVGDVSTESAALGRPSRLEPEGLLVRHFLPT